MNIEYAIIVRSKTRLESLIERFNTKLQAKFYIESLGSNFEEYQSEHDRFYFSLDHLQSQLSGLLKNKILYREHLPNYIFSNKNIIVVIGQDGLVANTAKYAKGVPIIAVNPDKERYDGILLPFTTDNFTNGILEVIEDKYQSKKTRFAEAKLNDGQRLLAFNDLFIGATSHVSARYQINFNRKIETQSSSGIIVSTKTGATGWMSSIFNMAHGLTRLSNRHSNHSQINFKDNQLFFAVREPFKSISSQIDICNGIIHQQNSLEIESYMPNNGIIFSDGIEKDFLSFNSGSIVSIGISKEFASLVLNSKNVQITNSRKRVLSKRN